MDVDHSLSSSVSSTSVSVNTSQTASSCAPCMDNTTSPTVIIVLGMAGSGKTSFVQVIQLFYLIRL